MALSIKNPEVEQLAAEVASLAGETKTEAVRQALLERRARLGGEDRARLKKERLLRFLETELWPSVPADQLGKRLTKAEEEEILGIGPEGY